MPGANKLSAMQFVVAFGVVSMLTDIVYEGARSIIGPYLANFGASAVLVGFVTGAGEAVALVLRLATGRLTDRTRKYWSLSIAGYAITVVAVPLLSVAANLWQAAALVIAERFGKAVRTPARDTMLAQAGTGHGRGLVFAIHETLDQSGALIGPLVVAGMITVWGIRSAFLVLAIPGALALIVVSALRRRVPLPQAYESQPVAGGSAHARADIGGSLPRLFWLYSAFTALSMMGFATFGVISYHLEVAHLMAPRLIPVTYAAAMGAGALSALASGRLYDRIGFRGLAAVGPLSVIIPMLAFSRSLSLIWVGAIVWGTVSGIHGSTLRAAVADLTPAPRRATAYGTFTAVYGLAWLAGATLIGALYERSVDEVVAFTAVTQVLATVALVPLMRIRRAHVR